MKKNIVIVLILFSAVIYVNGIYVNVIYAEELVNEAADNWRDIALEYVENGMPDKSIPFFRQAIRMNPSEGALHSALGYALQLTEAYETSFLEYTAAIGLEDTFLPDVKFNIGLMFSNQKKWKEAYNNYTDVLKFDTQYADAYLNRGMVSIYLQKYKQAEKDLRTFLELQPEDEQKVAVEEMIALLVGMRNFPENTVDKGQYNEKRALEERLNKNRERLKTNPSNQFLGSGIQ